MSTHQTLSSLSAPSGLFLRNEYERTIRQAGLEFDPGYFEALISMYRDPARVYHNEDHIAKVVQRIQATHHYVSLDEYIATKLAAFYHDCVYVPGWDQNEIQSAQVAYDHLVSMGAIDVINIYDVKSFILRTQNHKAPDGFNGAALLCDADLYELGTENYWKNSVLIWHEFGQPDDEAWTEGRRAFLMNYLNRHKIFHLPGQEELEEQARTNMQEELKALGGCPNDTNGDGDCGKRFCPYCGS